MEVIFIKPNLTKDMSIKDFKEFYWLKEELQLFCKENRINAYGSKKEISNRIEIFLITGERKGSIKRPKLNKKEKAQIDLNLNTVITENHSCSQEVRTFFKTVIPKFHFSTYIQSYFKNNIGKTYSDVVDAWYEEEERKKDPLYKKNIAPQFEYNQFIQDFFADPKNKGKSRKEAIECWNNIKNLRGNNKYTPTN